MPISAVVGKKEIMMEMEEIFFSGTFGGETLSLAAAIAVIDKMKREKVIELLWKKGSYLSEEVNSLIIENSLTDIVKLSGKPPWMILNFFDYEDIEGAFIKTYYMVEMLKNGILTSGSHNICHAHTDEDLEHILKAYDQTFINISRALNDQKIKDILPCPIIRPVFSVRES